MSLKPIYSVNDLNSYLSENFDPINLSISKVNKDYKAELIFKDSQVTKLFRVIKNQFLEVKEE